MENKQRDYFFDNAKFLLILFVIIGHAIEPLVFKSSIYKTFYIFFYLFHIPAFVLISGYFSKNINKPGRFKKIIFRMVIPYIIFSILYYLFLRFALGQPKASFNLLWPYWVLWFLCSLFIWNIILPFFVKIKYNLIIAFILSIIAGYIYDIGYFLSLSRTFVFFPFFLLGYHLKPEHFKRLFPKQRKTLPLAGITLILVAIYFLLPIIDHRWLYGSYCYSQLGHREWYAGIYRIMHYLSSIIICYLFFFMVPQTKTFFSSMGINTLNAFLLHGFIIKYCISIGFYNLIDSPVEKVLLVAAAILCTVVLSSNVAAKAVKPLTNPI